MYKTDRFVQTLGVSLARLSMHGIWTDVVIVLEPVAFAFFFSFLFFGHGCWGGEENTRGQNRNLYMDRGIWINGDGRKGGGEEEG